MNPAPPVISARRFEDDAATRKPYRRRRTWSSEGLPKLVSVKGRRALLLVVYVFHLRQYADAEGRLPSEFDALVEERSATSSLPTSR
jgi:hypothetical protein